MQNVLQPRTCENIQDILFKCSDLSYYQPQKQPFGKNWHCLEAYMYTFTIIIIINNSYKVLLKPELNSLCCTNITKTTLTYISANKILIIVALITSIA